MFRKPLTSDGRRPGDEPPVRVEHVPQVPEQPTLTDGVVTLRRWRLEDVGEAVAGHDGVVVPASGRPLDEVTHRAAHGRHP